MVCCWEAWSPTHLYLEPAVYRMIATLTFNPAVDHTITLQEVLRSGAVQRTDEDRFDAAGKGINVAKFLHAFDLPVTATGPIGGFSGKLVKDELIGSGIEAAFTSIAGTTRVNTTIEAAGGEYKINMDGPRVDQDDIAALRHRIQDIAPDTLMMGGSLPPGMSITDVEELMGSGDWRVALDMGGEALAAIGADCFMAKPNEQELEEATGVDVDGRGDAVRAAKELHEGGIEYVLASLGQDGAILVTDEGVWHAAALDHEIADTVGAGDATVAGFLAGLEQGDGPVDALCLSMALASRVVQLSGPQVPSLEGIEDLAGSVTVQEL